MEQACAKTVIALEKEVEDCKRIEEALRERERFLGAVFDSIQDGISVLDPELNIVRVNRTLQNWYANMLPLEGKKCYQAYHGRSKACEVCPTLRALNTGRLEMDEVPLTQADGVTGTLELFAFPMLNESGRVTGVIEYVRDITERKQAEEAIIRAKKEWESAFDTVPDLIMIVDDSYRIVRINKAMADRLGVTPDKAIGLTCYEYVHGTEEPPPFCPHARFLADGREHAAEIHEKRLGGDFLVTVSPFHGPKGRLIGCAHVARDITERKKAEAQLKQVQKLEAIGVLAGGIAHDFNNLLSVIMGNISLAKDDVKPEYGVTEFLVEAEKASQRAQALTKQLITFSKGGAPVKEIGAIGGLVKETTNFVLSGFNVECDFLLPHDLWLVECDEGQMQNAIKNFIVNAAESMPDGGSIDVGAENFEIGAKAANRNLSLLEGKYVKISIRDQGIGIPEEHLSMVFDPYFSTKERGTQKGMGLGLATAYSIINSHDGHITVESEVGVGTTFTLYLPAHEKDIRALKPVKIPKPEKPPIRTGRILLMDDEEMIRNLGRQMLSKFGYDAVLAKDGGEAIELYKKAMDFGKPFEVVILDLTVKGGRGGKDAVKKILAINPRAKAIVSSGYSNDPVMTDFRKYGFIGALLKPYTLKDLSDALNKIQVIK